MSAWGLSESDFSDQLNETFEIFVWLENERAFNVFCFMDTQWRSGMNGVEGLDYNVLYRHLDRMKLSDDEYEQLFSDVRVMEYTHLSELNKLREEKKPS